MKAASRTSEILQSGPIEGSGYKRVLFFKNREEWSWRQFRGMKGCHCHQGLGVGLSSVTEGRATSSVSAGQAVVVVPRAKVAGAATLMGSEGRATLVRTEDRPWNWRGLFLSLKIDRICSAFRLAWDPRLLSSLQFLPTEISVQWLPHPLYFGSW